MRDRLVNQVEQTHAELVVGEDEDLEVSQELHTMSNKQHKSIK